MTKLTPFSRAGLGCMTAFMMVAAHGSEREQLETLRQTTVNLIQALVQQNVLTQEKADQIIRQAEAKAVETVAAQKKAEEGVVRVQYVPESVRKQIADQVREEVVAQAKAERWDANTVPEWTDRIRFDGDVRFGLQADRFAAGNAPEFFHQVTGQNISNTLEDRERMRVRARLRLTARITQDVSASVRLVTGSLTDPVSTNQTLGQTANKFSFALDRAFIRARSRTFLPWLTASAGRVPNPFFSTNLVWDDDLSFDGAALQASPPIDEPRVWRPFGAVGVFPLQDIESSAAVKAKSKWLLAAQAGVEWAPDYDTNAKIGLALYDFRNISGIRNDFQQTAFNRTAPDFRQKGNTLFNIANTAPASSLFALASDFRLLNLTGSVDLNLFNPVHVMLSGDYVKNIGFDRAKTLARTGAVLDADTTGYMAQLAVGMPTIETRGDWQLSLGYRRLGADAVPDAFTDSDFHLGGTNHKGFFLGAQYGLAKNVWLNARWMSSNEIRGLPLSIDAFQVYLNARF
jgi:hypothetical protein